MQSGMNRGTYIYHDDLKKDSGRWIDGVPKQVRELGRLGLRPVLVPADSEEAARTAVQGHEGSVLVIDGHGSGQFISGIDYGQLINELADLLSNTTLVVLGGCDQSQLAALLVQRIPGVVVLHWGDGSGETPPRGGADATINNVADYLSSGVVEGNALMVKVVRSA